VSFESFDAEPEDSWDRGDTIDEQLANLRRRAALLLIAAARHSDDGDRARAIEVLSLIVRLARLRNVVGRDLVRADQLDEDLWFVLGRL
jgi:hypothetical protein